MNLNKFKNLVQNIEIDKINTLLYILNQYNGVIIIGNGGSNAIASHIAVDYTKFLGKRCQAFTDASMLTCFFNDEGVDNAYKEYLSNFVQDDTAVILISSSGNSKNIIKAAEYCDSKNVPFITLTGFSPNNTVRKKYNNSKNNLLDIWVDSNSYAVVECMHMIYLHAVVNA
tara:strand:- start:2647 stop:3159 length:513 start_codon:yes stop_codon:yes gene_type:complete